MTFTLVPRSYAPQSWRVGSLAHLVSLIGRVAAILEAYPAAAAGDDVLEAAQALAGGCSMSSCRVLERR